MHGRRDGRDADGSCRSLSHALRPAFERGAVARTGVPACRNAQSGNDRARETGGITERRVIVQKEVIRSGVGFGSALAIAISFTTHKSVLWAIVHGLFSWFYVAYYVLTR